MIDAEAVIRLEGPTYTLAPPTKRELAAFSSIRGDLEARWKEALRTAERAEKGRALESFAAAFFGCAFRVVERNLRTENEELDLAVEPSDNTPSVLCRYMYGIVECKNWRKPVDQSVVSTLSSKLQAKRQELGFVLATRRITREARQQARDLFKRLGTLLLLIDGETIEAFLESTQTVAELLNDLHRDLVLDRRSTGGRRTTGT